MPSLWLGSWPGARPVPRVCRMVARLWCVPPVYTWLAQRLERRPHLGGKEVGLFPGGEVADPVDLVIADEVVGISALRPAPWGLIDLVAEDVGGKRDRDGFGLEEGRLVFPVQPGRGNPGVRQPVHRDVVEDVISCQGALQLSLKGLLYQPRLAAAVAVVNHERGQIGG